MNMFQEPFMKECVHLQQVLNDQLDIKKKQYKLKFFLWCYPVILLPGQSRSKRNKGRQGFTFLKQNVTEEVTVKP